MAFPMNNYKKKKHISKSANIISYPTFCYLQCGTKAANDVCSSLGTNPCISGLCFTVGTSLIPAWFPCKSLYKQTSSK